jgi:hypothetical protein
MSPRSNSYLSKQSPCTSSQPFSHASATHCPLIQETWPRAIPLTCVQLWHVNGLVGRDRQEAYSCPAGVLNVPLMMYSPKAQPPHECTELVISVHYTLLELTLSLGSEPLGSSLDTPTSPLEHDKLVVIDHITISYSPFSSYSISSRSYVEPARP